MKAAGRTTLFSIKYRVKIQDEYYNRYKLIYLFENSNK